MKALWPENDPKLEQTLAETTWMRVGDGAGITDFVGEGWESVWMTGPHGRWTGRDRYKRNLVGPAGRGRYFLSPSAAIRAVVASYAGSPYRAIEGDHESCHACQECDWAAKCGGEDHCERTGHRVRTEWVAYFRSRAIEAGHAAHDLPVYRFSMGS